MMHENNYQRQLPGLSSRQKAMYHFIGEYVDRHGYPPSIRDIQAGCDISSTSVVDYNLKKMEALGYIRRDPEVSRSIVLVM